MNKSLLKELEHLVRANILTPELAEKILEYYKSRESATNTRFNNVLAILGAILTGFGIVLLVAHNWDDMPGPVRTLFAFLPLAVGQGLCAFTLLRKKENRSWRESSAVFLFFAVAACMALISQIYHMKGTLEGFIFTWLLLTAALVYIMRSSMVSLLALAVSTWYAVLVGYNDIFGNGNVGESLLYIALLLFIAPHYYQYLKFQRQSAFFHLHNWMLVISSIIAFGAFAGKMEHWFHWIFIGYFCLFGIYYLVGESAYFNQARLFLNPFLIAGVIGSVMILLFWSYDELWRELEESSSQQQTGIFRSVFIYICLGLCMIHIYLLLRWNKLVQKEFDPMNFSMYVFAISVLVFSHLPVIGLILTNAWIFLIAMYYIRKGSIRDHLGILNFGLLIIASLALLRFFDDSIPFVWRGLFFVLTGIGFFLANYLLLKKRKSSP